MVGSGGSVAGATPVTGGSAVSARCVASAEAMAAVAERVAATDRASNGRSAPGPTSDATAWAPTGSCGAARSGRAGSVAGPGGGGGGGDGSGNRGSAELGNTAVGVAMVSGTPPVRRVATMSRTFCSCSCRSAARRAWREMEVAIAAASRRSGDSTAAAPGVLEADVAVEEEAVVNAPPATPRCGEAGADSRTAASAVSGHGAGAGAAAASSTNDGGGSTAGGACSTARGDVRTAGGGGVGARSDAFHSVLAVACDTYRGDSSFRSVRPSAASASAAASTVSAVVGTGTTAVGLDAPPLPGSPVGPAERVRR